MYSSQLSNFQILAVVMPSENESDLAKCLSDLKEELRAGFSSLKRELVEENSFAECQAEGTLIVPVGFISFLAHAFRSSVSVFFFS